MCARTETLCNNTRMSTLVVQILIATPLTRITQGVILDSLIRPGWNHAVLREYATFTSMSLSDSCCSMANLCREEASSAGKETCSVRNETSGVSGPRDSKSASNVQL